MNTAILVIDMQIDVVARAFRRAEVVANIAELVKQARDKAIPVIWVQHSDDGLVKGSDGWAYVPELQAQESESVVHKAFGDSFEGTDLEELLRRAEIQRLIVCGAQTDACIRSTLHGAIVRGYDTLLVSDAHTTDDCDYTEPALSAEQIIAHTNSYWKWQRTPNATGGSLTASEVVSQWVS